VPVATFRIGTFFSLMPTPLLLLHLALGLVAFGSSVRASGESPPAPEFCADIVTRDASGLPVGAVARLYVANRKARIETAEVSAGFFLVDGQAETAVFVRSTPPVFMDAGLSSRLTQIFVPVDPNDPCRQWQAAAKNAGVPGAGGAWRCGRILEAKVGEGASLEYRVLSPDQKSSLRWIDPQLEFPVKLREADGTTIELEHVQIKAQRASMFAVPAGYRKLDPHALIERIKHSDVWADP
jgi:hypothetical protein